VVIAKYLDMLKDSIQEMLDKCQNIYILALNLHLLISWFLLFCFILFPFCVFCIFVCYGRNGSIFGKFPSLKGKLGRPRRYGKDEIGIYQIGVKIGLDSNLDSAHVSVFWP
jgi:hypothetical protein